MKTALTAISLTLLLSACAGIGERTVAIKTPFNAAETAAMNARGNGRFEGTAFLRTVGGDVVTCAGAKVSLTPATGYAMERLAAIYGSAFALGATKYRDRDESDVTIQPNPADYYTQSRSTICDARGLFEFQDVRDGQYFVTTKVLWRSGSRKNGGSLATLMAVQGGRANRVIITD